jgi:RecA-family ATPase
MNQHNLTPGQQSKVTANIDFNNFIEHGEDDSGLLPSRLFEYVAETVKKSSSVITGEQLLLSDMDEMPKLIDPFLQRTGLACLAGSSDTGKSSVLRQLAISIAGGLPDFLGFRIEAKHRSVIFVSTEDGEDAARYLIKHQAASMEPSMLSGLRFIFDFENLLETLTAELMFAPADLIIIDCFGDAFGGDLKDTHRIRAFLNPFQKLSQQHECLILFLHHTGKRTEHSEPSKNNLLSGQGLEAKMRLVMELRADPMNPNLRHLCIVKGNYLSREYKSESFALSFDEQNFLFTNTGERVPFELLAKRTDGNDKAKAEQAKELLDAGYNYENIAKELGYASKGSVTKLFERAKQKGWDIATSHKSTS